MHSLLTLRIERCGRLVEQQDGSVLEDGPGNGDALPLATREPISSLPDDRIVPLGKRHDLFVYRCSSCSSFYICIAGCWSTSSNVLLHRRMEQERLLTNDGNLLQQRRMCQISVIDTVEVNLSSRRLPEASQNIEEG